MFNETNLNDILEHPERYLGGIIIITTIVMLIVKLFKR